jgi:hypothetical protein
MEVTWRVERPLAMTSASVSEERPARSMVVMSSALSSSSDSRMRASSEGSSGLISALASSFFAGFLAPVFAGAFAGVFLARGLGGAAFLLAGI